MRRRGVEHTDDDTPQRPGAVMQLSTTPQRLWALVAGA
jgi:hypothetical protein